MVEAALVLPLMILTISGFISVTVFCYKGLDAQCDLQGTLLEQAAEENGIVHRFEEFNEISFPITGIDRLVFQKAYSGHLTVYDEDALVRAGGAVSGLFD